jgi:hypothetical protein
MGMLAQPEWIGQAELLRRDPTRGGPVTMARYETGHDMRARDPEDRRAILARTQGFEMA